jgi:hypothetical protein
MAAPQNSAQNGKNKKNILHILTKFQRFLRNTHMQILLSAPN